MAKTAITSPLASAPAPTVMDVESLYSRSDRETIRNQLERAWGT